MEKCTFFPVLPNSSVNTATKSGHYHGLMWTQVVYHKKLSIWCIMNDWGWHWGKSCIYVIPQRMKPNQFQVV